MNTFFRVLLAIAAVLVIAHFCPLALFPLGLAGALLVGLGGLTVGGLTLMVVVGAVLACVALAVIVAFAAASSPIWLPVLIIFGVVALCRRGARTT